MLYKSTKVEKIVILEKCIWSYNAQNSEFNYALFTSCNASTVLLRHFCNFILGPRRCHSTEVLQLQKVHSSFAQGHS